MIRSLPLVSIFALGLLGCGASDPELETPSATAPKLVGKIASVHAADGFALVETYGEVALGQGLLLTTVGEGGRTAALTVSGEHLGRFAAADLRSGSVEPGDAVYGRPMLETSPDFTPDPAPAAEGPAIPDFPAMMPGGMN
ncbi:hypothetical protein HNR46_000878 [Haloferula luteola]|uniref:Uncharacterized protein n=1 Tax=Haloferula luteola TaxID=595692 RepID=A0A840V9M0_9BACT|nr:hypothetical protein [Haloferula luteola]MBB5350650.1 hypothetical protein [Haloferula luteola]